MGLSAFNAMRARELAKQNAEKSTLKVEEAPVTKVDVIEEKTEITSTKKTDAEKLKKKKE